MIKKMLKVQIIGPRAIIDGSIRELHTAGVVHIETVPEELIRESDFLGKLPIEKDKLVEKETLEGYAERLRALMALLPRPASFRAEKVAPALVPRRMGELAPIEERARALSRRKDRLTEELAVTVRYEKLLRGFAPMVTRLGGMKNFDITGLTLEKTREDIAGLLEAELSRATDGMYSMHARQIDEHTIGVVLAYPRTHTRQVKSLLTGRALSEMRLPDEYSEMALIDALVQMGRRKAELPGLVDDMDRELYAVSSMWYAAAAGAARAVDEALEEIGVLSFAAATRFAFIIEGWVPADAYPGLDERLAALFGGRLHMRTLDISREEMDSVPVFIKNPRALRPFEVFLSALPPPKYGSIDPTPFVAVFFPSFFGLIVADMGYGALTLALAVYLRARLRARPFFRDVSTVFIVSAASAIFFGFLFGELFGDLGERTSLVHPILVSRIEALKTLMAVALAIGVGHVLLGVSIGFVSRAARGDFREAAAKGAFLVLIVSTLLMAGIIFGFIPRSLMPWTALVMALAFVAMTVLEGVLGPIEFVEGLGSIVSYIRLMAVGTASVVMALVANRMGALPESLAAGVAIAALMHLLNFLLSVLSPSIQSMRLQYVEFFGKFYEGGGRLYRPFRKK